MHQLYLDFKGWVKTRDLIENDEVIHCNEGVSKINKIYKEVLDMPEDTYNFEVEDCHTYYVTDSNVLVHNVCLYRGGNDMTPRKMDIATDLNGNVLPEKGISVNSDPSKVARFWHPHKIGKLPDGLKIIHTSGTHFEIIPTYAMPLEQYQNLLNMIPLTPL